jgi:hypothetical protein
VRSREVFGLYEPVMTLSPELVQVRSFRYMRTVMGRMQPWGFEGEADGDSVRVDVVDGTRGAGGSALAGGAPMDGGGIGSGDGGWVAFCDPDADVRAGWMCTRGSERFVVMGVALWPGHAELRLSRLQE